MKKITGVLLSAVLITVLLAGCSSSKADTNTITLEKNGKITEQIAEEFAEDYYDESELKEYIEEEVEAYTSENGKSSVKMSGFDVDEGIAYLTMKYADADTYAAFKNVEFFRGTILEAQSAGYSFDDISFLAVGDSDAADDADSGSLSEESAETTAAEADPDTVLEDDQNTVVILREAVTVVVPGTVLYVSADGTEVTEDDTVVITADEDTGVVPEVYIIYE